VPSNTRETPPSIPERLRLRIVARPPLALFAFACSLAGIAYSVFVVEALPLARSAVESARILAVARLAFLAVMAGCSLLFLASRTATWFRTGLAVKVLATLLYLAAGPYPSGIEVAVVAPLLLEIALSEAFFLNLLVCLGVVALSLFPRAHPFLTPGADASLAEMLPHLSFGLYLLCFAVVSCLLVHYRERCIDRAERIGQLEGAVAKLTTTNLGYQNYASEASGRSQKEERLRITRELHDTIGYTFTNNIMMLEAAVSKIHKDPQKVRQLITMARANTETGLESVRKTLYLLRSQEPLRVPSANKIHQLVDVFRVATGIDASVDFANFPNEVDHELESAFYSFIQEALTNAFRHGAATSIGVQLMRTDCSLIAMVSDNGRGAETVVEGIGITGMRERIGALGGAVRIPPMRTGFRIAAEVPYREEDGHGA
jgi:signal transduction histidine kinase